MSESKIITPTSRLCFKNLPPTMDEPALREKIMVETKRGGAKAGTPIVQVTDVKIMRINGKSRRFGFVGFKSDEQAEIALKYWNKAFMGPSRVEVEYAALPGSNAIRPWSKYSSGASANPETIAAREQKEREFEESRALLSVSSKTSARDLKRAGLSTSASEKLKQERIKRALHMHPILFGLTPEQREQVMNNGTFHDYISLLVDKRSKDRNFWDNDDQSRETNTLRALYLALNEGNDADKDAAAAANNTPSYEEVMKSMEGKKKNKKSGNNDDDSDDEEYFDNPSLNDDDGNEDEEDDEDGSGKAKAEHKEMQKLVQDILKKNVANASITDSDYFKLKTGNIDDDSDTDFTDAEMDDDDDNDDKESSTSKTSTSSGNKKRVRGDDDDASDNDDDEESRTKDAKKSKSNTVDAELFKETQDKLQKVREMTEEEAIATIRTTSKLFVRRLPFTTTKDDLLDYFDTYGEIKDITMPTDMNNECKGYAYVTYMNPENAVNAFLNLQNQVFQGRMIHIVAGIQAGKDTFDPENPFAHLGDDELKKMSYKEKKKLIDKANAQKGHNWNSLFINADTVANAVAHKFNLKKSDLLGADQFNTHESAGVRMAVAETHLINETKEFLEANGVILDKFTSRPGEKNLDKLSDTIFLIKNIPFDTEEMELRKLLKKFGPIQRLILPPYRTMCVVEYNNSSAAKKAYMGIAYKKFKHVPIYVEWAPKNCLLPVDQITGLSGVVVAPKSKLEKVETAIEEKTSQFSKFDEDDDDESKSGSTSKLVIPEEEEGSRSLFVKNIHFDTKEDDLRTLFTKLASEAYPLYVAQMRAQGKEITASEWRVRAVVIAKRTVTSTTGLDKHHKVGDVLSLGYGFIEVSTASAAKGIAALVAQRKGVVLDGHLLEVRVSTKAQATDAAHVDLTKKSILVQKGILSDEKLKQQQEWSKLSSKLIVRNIPFEANASEIRELFKTFGQLRRVKLPRKVDNTSHRGFGFVDFVTAQEARNAYSALQNTHLYGRHLVLEWAAPDETIEELRKKAKKAIE